MLQHARKHGSGEIVEVGEKFRAKQTYFVPDTHECCPCTGKMGFGGNARLHKVVLPTSIEVRDGTLCCRKCDEALCEYNESMKSQKKAAVIRYFEQHEARRLGNKKK